VLLLRPERAVLRVGVHLEEGGGGAEESERVGRGHGEDGHQQRDGD
jgi:hypothetical protein